MKAFKLHHNDYNNNITIVLIYYKSNHYFRFLNNIDLSTNKCSVSSINQQNFFDHLILPIKIIELHTCMAKKIVPNCLNSIEILNNSYHKSFQAKNEIILYS